MTEETTISAVPGKTSSTRWLRQFHDARLLNNNQRRWTTTTITFLLCHTNTW